MSGNVEFSSLNTKEDVKIKLEQPDRVPRKPSDEEVAKHSKTRLVLVVFFGIVILAMVVAAVIIIVVSPKCAKVIDEGGVEADVDIKQDKTWWKHEVVYHVYPRSFKDSNDDRNGDLKGITEKLDYIKGLGIKVLCLDSIYDIANHTAINKMFGTMADFDDLLKKANESEIKIILDFVPNHTSDKHPWFVESASSKGSSKRDWYIWRDGKNPVVNGSDAAPNNWISVFGGSAWEYHASGQFYLHQFYKEQPDLNLNNPAVIKALKEAMQFWLDKGVDGFRGEAFQFMVEDPSYRDEPEKSNYNATDLKYDMLDHVYTHDLDENRDIVQQFRKLMDNKTDSYRVLMAEVQGSNNRTGMYFEVCDYPFNFNLISGLKLPGKSLSQSIEKSVSDYLAALPEGKWPNWAIGNDDVYRVGDRVQGDNINAMNVLLLTLPGTPTTYYGEEIGMVNGEVINGSDPMDPERTPMQWTSGKDAGFTGAAAEPWLPVGKNKATVNVEEEMKKNTSTLYLYKQLVGLRSEDAFNSTDLKVVHVDEKLFGYTRGDGKYLVAINFSDKKWDGDFEGISVKLGTVIVDTEFKEIGTQYDVNKLSLNPGQAFVLELHE